MAITIGILATTLSGVGGVVCVSGKADERIITVKSTGGSIPGSVVGVVGTGTHSATAGDLVASDAGGSDFFTGIVLPKYNVDCDTAVADGDLVEIVVPRAGKLYNVYITNPGANFAAGTPVEISATAGEMIIQDSGIEDADTSAILTKNILNTTRFAEVRWR